MLKRKGSSSLIELFQYDVLVYALNIKLTIHVLNNSYYIVPNTLTILIKTNLNTNHDISFYILLMLWAHNKK